VPELFRYFSDDSQGIKGGVLQDGSIFFQVSLTVAARRTYSLWGCVPQHHIACSETHKILLMMGVFDAMTILNGSAAGFDNAGCPRFNRTARRRR
jgi:hypothetical protein